MLNERYQTLDYLRGLMAFSIMLFHYYIDKIPGSLFNQLLGRLGIYGVSVFYVLSGLTLYLVYKRAENFNGKFLSTFVIKRVFRIFPILWLAIILTLLIKQKHFSYYDLFLNFTGLFGFLDPTNCVAKGQWSLGNELVFYSFFPLLLFLARKHFKLFLCFLFIAASLLIYFAFFIMNATGEIHKDHLADYVNPFNQLFFFVSGVFIGSLYHRGYLTWLKRFAIPGLLLSFLLFTFLPVENGERIHLAIGYYRLLFTGLSICICLFSFLSEFNFPSLIHHSLSKLGEISYSLYLLHPIVYRLVKMAHKHIHLPTAYTKLASIFVSLIVSYLIYISFEKTFINIGKKLVGRIK